MKSDLESLFLISNLKDSEFWFKHGGDLEACRAGWHFWIVDDLFFILRLSNGYLER